MYLHETLVAKLRIHHLVCCCRLLHAFVLSLQSTESIGVEENLSYVKRKTTNKQVHIFRDIFIYVSDIDDAYSPICACIDIIYTQIEVSSSDYFTKLQESHSKLLFLEGL